MGFFFKNKKKNKEEETVTPEVPGSILRFHPDVTIIADEAAMSLIK